MLEHGSYSLPSPPHTVALLAVSLTYLQKQHRLLGCLENGSAGLLASHTSMVSGSTIIIS